MFWQVAVLLGEVIGHYTNDWIMNRSIRRNAGVFEAESRLWCVLSSVCLAYVAETSQGLLYFYPAIHLRFCRVGRFVPGSPQCWCTDYGLGNRGNRVRLISAHN